MIDSLKQSWTTKDELAFFNRLGQHSAFGPPSVELQARYYEANCKRKNWGALDQGVIQTHVRKILDKGQK